MIERHKDDHDSAQPVDRRSRGRGTHRDKDAVAIVNALSRLDAEARVCRGQYAK
jgi:hypothetical protein